MPERMHSAHISIFFKTVQTMSSLLLYIYILVVGIFFFIRACGFFLRKNTHREARARTAFLYFPPIQPFTAKAPIRRFDLAIE